MPSFSWSPGWRFNSLQRTGLQSVIVDVSFCTDSIAPAIHDQRMVTLRAKSAALIQWDVFQRVIWALVGLTLIVLSYVVGRY